VPEDVKLPELAESVVEGEIVQWLVAAGDAVAVDQPLVEVMTDKVTVEIPSPWAGVLVEQMAKEGDVVPVGAPVARFAEAGEEAGAAAPAPGAPSPAPQEDDGDALSLFKAGAPQDDGPLPRIRRPAATSVAPAAAPAASASASAPSAADRPRGPWGRPLAVPAARKRARELGVPLDQVLGSGPHGRVRVADVEAQGAATAAAGSAPAGAAPAAGRAPLPPYRATPLRPAPAGPEATRVPLRGVRRRISEQLLRGHLTTVQTLAVEEADVSELVALRERLKARAAARGVKLSYLPFVLKALTRSLAAYPAMNARMDEEAGEIVRYRDAHLGLAVDTDDGLIVPVIRDASRRSLLDLGAEVARLAEAARTGKLRPDDLQGGTFSVTNIGSVGALLSMPVLNAPEAGILGVHRIKKRPVVLADDSIAARPMLYLSLTFDHRIIDGAEATRFLTHLIDQLEDPETVLFGDDGLADAMLDA
jgi:pyruvate dehydrogenase E2 component (dihydrolipoamide acetyltransferase)